MNEDPRLGLPSASKLARVFQCPGSENMIRSLPPEAFSRKPEEDELAMRGTKIHAAREKMSDDDLDPEDAELYQRGIKFEQDLIKEWAAAHGIGIGNAQEGPRELRLFLNDPETFDPLASGQLDVHYTASPHALVIDWKTLYCQNLPPSNKSAQLRFQAVLLWQNRDGIEHIRVAYDKPMAYKGGADDFTDYTVDDLKFSLYEIQFGLWQARKKDAQRVPGPECRYCPAKAYCREAAAYALLPSIQKYGDHTAISPKPEEVAAHMTIEDVVEVWRMGGLAGKVIEECKDRLKTQPPEVLAQFGLEVKAGRKLDPITNGAGLWSFLENAGWSFDQIVQCVKFGKGELAKVIMAREGCPEKLAKNRLDKEFAPFIERKNADGSVGYIKGI